MRLMRILCACFRMDVELLELSADDLHLRIKPYFPDSYQAIRDMVSVGFGRTRWTPSNPTSVTNAQLTSSIHAPG